MCRFLYYGPYTVQRLTPSSGPLTGGTAVRVLGGGFVETAELTVCVTMRGVERRMPAAFISDAECRFLTPTFSEAGSAKVTVSLNGHDYDGSGELAFEYHPDPIPCAVS